MPRSSRKKTTELGVFDPGSTSLGEMTFRFPDDLPPGDPLEAVEQPEGDPDRTWENVLNAYQKELAHGMRRYDSTYKGVFNSGFWFAVAFKSEEDKIAFLEEFSFVPDGTDLRMPYIDGGKLAKRMRKALGSGK